MTIEPLVLSSITAAITLLGQDYAKGLASEAGKNTWTTIRGLFGWNSEPAVAEIPEKVASGLTASPKSQKSWWKLLKQESTGAASSLIQNLTISGGKVIFAQVIHVVNTSAANHHVH